LGLQRGPDWHDDHLTPAVAESQRRERVDDLDSVEPEAQGFAQELPVEMDCYVGAGDFDASQFDPGPLVRARRSAKQRKMFTRYLQSDGVVHGIVVGHPCHGPNHFFCRSSLDIDCCLDGSEIRDHGTPVWVIAVMRPRDKP